VVVLVFSADFSVDFGVDFDFDFEFNFDFGVTLPFDRLTLPLAGETDPSTSATSSSSPVRAEEVVEAALETGFEGDRDFEALGLALAPAL
jgi:hypothetical protein